MNQNLRWKALFIFAVILVCLWGLFARPSFPTSWQQVKQNFQHGIKLGLDLKGGSELVLQVHRQDAIRYQCDRVLDSLTRELNAKGIKTGEIKQQGDTQILVTSVALDQTAAFRSLVQTDYPDWDLSLAGGQANGYLLALKPAAVAALDSQTMQTEIDTLNQRINGLGLSETKVAPYGSQGNEIMIELPGVGDPAEAESVINTQGTLELHKVIDGPYPSEAEALAAHGGIMPQGTTIVPGAADETSQQAGATVYYVLTQNPVVTGADLKGASAEMNPEMPGQWQVQFDLDRAGADAFGPFTAANIGQRLAIVLDGKVKSAPVIQGHITDTGQITGSFTQEQANALAIVLKAGRLPASVSYESKSTVGPSLGADSIREGVLASIISLLAVMIFLLFYYRLSGVNAVLALFLNLVILLAALAYFSFVLTLPGIAGVILTIGMGVDSNVLVFERIREELRAGKANASAVDLGFEKAFLTIIDTHVTTVVSAIFLSMFGSGPVRGFAITLIIGLVANLFTSIYVSRTIFEWHLGRMTRQAELSI